jgi:Lar family restriction alleviation protein
MVILPCPFCGGEARINQTTYSNKENSIVKLNGTNVFYGVNCISCGADTRGLVGSKTEQEAIDRWNKRIK